MNRKISLNRLHVSANTFFLFAKKLINGFLAFGASLTRFSNDSSTVKLATIYKSIILSVVFSSHLLADQRIPIGQGPKPGPGIRPSGVVPAAVASPENLPQLRPQGKPTPNADLKRPSDIPKPMPPATSKGAATVGSKQASGTHYRNYNPFKDIDFILRAEWDPEALRYFENQAKEKLAFAKAVSEVKKERARDEAIREKARLEQIAIRQKAEPYDDYRLEKEFEKEKLKNEANFNKTAIEFAKQERQQRIKKKYEKRALISKFYRERTQIFQQQLQEQADRQPAMIKMPGSSSSPASRPPVR